jgi:hypothetical protein
MNSPRNLFRWLVVTHSKVHQSRRYLVSGGAIVVIVVVRVIIVVRVIVVIRVIVGIRVVVVVVRVIVVILVRAVCPLLLLSLKKLSKLCCRTTARNNVVGV